MLNDIDSTIHDLTAAVVNYGHRKTSRTGHDTLMLPAQMMRFQLGGQRMPILSTRLVRYINSMHEMDMFKTGSPSIKPLCDRKIGIWDSWFIPGTAVYDEPRYEKVRLEDRVSALTDPNHIQTVRTFLDTYESAKKSLGSTQLTFKLGDEDVEWSNVSSVGIELLEGILRLNCASPDEIKVGGGEEVTLKKRLSRVSKNDGAKWVIIYPRILEAGATGDDENPVKVTVWNPEELEFEDHFLNPTYIPGVVQVLDKLEIPKYRLLDASIGEGSYGVQWRKWQDTQIVACDNKELLEAYHEEGYTYMGMLSGKFVMHREIDQLQNLITSLKTNPDDRRMIMTAWNPGRIWQAALPPCHLYFQVVSWEMSHSELERMLEDRGLFQDFISRHRDEEGRFQEDLFSDKGRAVQLLLEYITEKGLPTRAIAGFVLLRSFN